MKTYKYQLSSEDFMKLDLCDMVQYKSVCQYLTSANQWRVVYRLKQI